MSLTAVFFSVILALAAHVVLTWYLAIRQGRSANHRQDKNSLLHKKWPFASIIIPAWCERGTVESCIIALQSIDYSHWEAVIVAGGPDGTYSSVIEMTRGLKNFTVIEQAPHGKNAALNQGLAIVSGEVVVFLDADSRVAPGWLKELVCHLGGSVQATTGNILPMRDTHVSAGYQMEWLAAQEIDRANSLFGAGGIALQRCLVDQMGRLPEEVRVGVDWDLNHRLAAEKVGRAYCKSAIVRTELPATITEYWQNELRWRRAHLSALLRQPGLYLSNLKSILDNLYIYILAWSAAFASLAAALLLLVDGGRLALQILVLWATLAGWVLLRRASLAAQVAAYTGEIRWLRLVWVPPLLLIISLAAILPASLTLGKQTAHFKGPRSQQLHPTLDG